MDETANSQPKNRQAEQSVKLQFLMALNMLLHSARIHQDNNRVLISSVEKFTAVIRRLLEEDHEITLLTYKGRFYLQQEKIVYRSNLADHIESLLDFFTGRKLNGLRFSMGIEHASVSEIAAFARLMIAAEKEDDPPSWLGDELLARKLAWVDYVPASDETFKEIIDSEPAPDTEDIQPSDQEQDTPETRELVSPERTKEQEAVLIYGYTVRVLQYISKSITRSEKTGIKKALKMVHKLIDMVAEDADILLGLSTIKDYDDYTFTHSINVAILSVCLGHRIGLSKKSLEMLTLSAFFHDLGKIEVPKSILNKPGKLTDSELKEMKNHSLYSVRQILFLKTTPQKKAEMILPPFEHHLKYDLSGYPQTPRSKPVSLFGRILAIADVYDALTSPRVYRPFAITPDRALSIMQEGSGKDFDPLLLKVFVNMIGVYPVGTVLKFANGDIGLVAKYSGKEETNRELWVQFLLSAPEQKFVKGDLVNLGSFDTASRGYRLPIAESMHPAAFNIQPADYLL